MNGTLVYRRFPSAVLLVCRHCLRARPFTTTVAVRQAEPKSPTGAAATAADEAQRALALNKIFGTPNFPPSGNNARVDDMLKQLDMDFKPRDLHHLHVMATKHNTHITLTNPDRNPIISRSAGSIGFKKSGRGSYDAAYQLAAYVLGQIYEGRTFAEIQRLEVVLRGFGIGREAVTKAILGTEGRRIRPKITQITDATRLKFGGTRSRKPRRLG